MTKVYVKVEETRVYMPGLDAALAKASADSAKVNAAQTAADRVQTGIDALQTVGDAILTAADRVQTGIDAGLANDAKVAAVAAQGLAEGARDDAVIAKGQAEGFATSAGLDAGKTAADRDAVETLYEFPVETELKVLNVVETASTATNDTYIEFSFGANTYRFHVQKL